MVSRTKGLLAIVALLAATGAVFAQEEPPKWGYIEGGFIDFDPDGGVSDDGFFAGGSIGLFKMFHIVAEYDEVGDYAFWNAGAGWHGLLGEPADLFAEVTWQDVDFDSDSAEFSDEGYEFAAGVRWMLGNRFELKGTGSWIDLDESGDDVIWEAEGLFFMLKNKLGVGASVEFGDADILRVFGRWNFGR